MLPIIRFNNGKIVFFLNFGFGMASIKTQTSIPKKTFPKKLDNIILTYYFYTIIIIFYVFRTV